MSTGVPLFNTFIRGAYPNLGLPQETRNIILWCIAYFDILDHSSLTHKCDKRMDRQTDILIANAALHYNVQAKHLVLRYFDLFC